ncbi:hypothetical protein WR25_12885 isoform C [Diploscapter pachys]|nr:hypothetical protein WR25_12885 isoform C [Diploscapter pachys]
MFDAGRFRILEIPKFFPEPSLTYSFFISWENNLKGKSEFLAYFITNVCFSFVNPGWLAELSSFFQDYCFGEDTAGSALIVDDISSAEMLEFLRCIFFCPTRKPLSIANIPLVLRVATRFEMKPVLARCEVFIANTVNTLDRNKLLQITTAVSQYDPNSSNLTVLIDRLASIREDELNPTQFSEMPGDVVADIYRHRMRTREKKRKEFGCVM